MSGLAEQREARARWTGRLKISLHDDWNGKPREAREEEKRLGRGKLAWRTAVWRGSHTLPRRAANVRLQSIAMQSAISRRPGRALLKTCRRTVSGCRSCSTVTRKTTAARARCKAITSPARTMHDIPSRGLRTQDMHRAQHSTGNRNGALIYSLPKESLVSHRQQSEQKPSQAMPQSGEMPASQPGYLPT